MSDAVQHSSSQQNSQQETPHIPPQTQPYPGEEKLMQPRPDHGETSYRGSGKLKNLVALITGGDSGIGKAVAIAFAREGADLCISYLNEDEDARDTEEWVKRAGRRAILQSGDISEERHCKEIVNKTVAAFGRIDILILNAAFQAVREKLEDISSEEWDRTFKTNIYAMFYLVKAALPHMQPGSAIVTTSSVNLDSPSPTLLAYAATKAAIQNFTGNLAQILAEQGIRANSVAPGPIWTPLIVATKPADKVATHGQKVPMHRPGQPAEVAPAYVLLASPEASYISGTTIAVTGGKPVI